MTDNNMKNEFQLDAEDEKLLQAFFADSQVEIADNGFSEKVMASLPVGKRVRLEHIWLVVCLLLGIAAFVMENGWSSIQDWFFSFKIEGLLSIAQVVSHIGGYLAHTSTHVVQMVLAGIATVVAVWGYNEVMDARARP